MNAILTSIKQNATLVETDLGFSQRGQNSSKTSKSILGYEVIFCQLLLRLSNVLHLKIAH